jgi:hypothetical protein
LLYWGYSLIGRKDDQFLYSRKYYLEMQLYNFQYYFISYWVVWLASVFNVPNQSLPKFQLASAGTYPYSIPYWHPLVCVGLISWMALQPWPQHCPHWLLTELIEKIKTKTKHLFWRIIPWVTKIIFHQLFLTCFLFFQVVNFTASIKNCTLWSNQCTIQAYLELPQWITPIQWIYPNEKMECLW